MTTLIATVLLIHGIALAGVLLMAKYSVVLVDDDGRPLKVTAWQERVVPSKPTTKSPTRRL